MGNRIVKKYDVNEQLLEAVVNKFKRRSTGNVNSWKSFHDDDVTSVLNDFKGQFVFDHVLATVYAVISTADGCEEENMNDAWIDSNIANPIISMKYLYLQFEV